MATDLYRPTPCEHGEMHAHGALVTRSKGNPTLVTPECSGGSYEEVTIDYEAAAQVFEIAGYRNKGIRILLDQAVDTALGITD